MATEDMLDLMGENPGQFLSGVGFLEKSLKDDQGSPWDGKSIDRGLVHHNQPKGIGRFGKRGSQGGKNLLDFPGPDQIGALFFLRSKVLYNRLPKSLLPGNRNMRGGDGSHGWDSP
jgi:hypothetical protein